MTQRPKKSLRKEVEKLISWEALERQTTILRAVVQSLPKAKVIL
jgi:hypothetical protein